MYLMYQYDIFYKGHLTDRYEYLSIRQTFIPLSGKPWGP